jgi:protein-S-isoprenylcysteine O-methyltransferase Ste14
VVLFAGGWLLVLLATFLINHFDLFGLRQICCTFEGANTRICRSPRRSSTTTSAPAVRRLDDGVLGHTHDDAGHLVFAAVNTVYMLIAIYFEERNLVEHHGRRYEEYRQRTGKLLPRLRPRATESGALASIKNA